MNLCKRPAVGALLTLCLFLLAEGLVAEKSRCRQARQSFKDGIWSFEQEEWETVVNHMHEALVTKGDCSEKQLRTFALYGRWFHSFAPEVYMGVALSHLAGCETDEIKNSACGKTVDTWWEGPR